MIFKCQRCGIIITYNLEKCNDIKYLQCINPECEYVNKNPNYKGDKK